MAFQITETDRKILHELDVNGRQALSKISANIKKSKQLIDYRIKKMQKTGVIKGFCTIIDHSKLGYFSFRIYLKLKNISPDKQKEMLEYLNRDQNIWWLVTIDGEWDIDFVVLVKNVFDYYSIWQEFTNKYMNHIYKHETVVYSHIQEFPKSYLLEKQNTKQGFLISTKIENIPLDILDIKILSLLSTNARIEITKISQQTQADTRTIIKRIKNLAEKGVIIGYRVVIDMNKLGYKHYKILFYLNNTKKLKQMNAYALAHPNITFLNQTIGGCDFELEINAANTEEFLKILHEFQHEFHEVIDHHYYFRVIDQYKMIYYPK